MDFSLLEYTDPADLLLPPSQMAAVAYKFGEPLVIETRPVPRPGEARF